MRQTIDQLSLFCFIEFCAVFITIFHPINARRQICAPFRRVQSNNILSQNEQQRHRTTDRQSVQMILLQCVMFILVANLSLSTIHLCISSTEGDTR